MKRNQFRRNAKTHVLPCSMPIVLVITLTISGLLSYWGLDARCDQLGNDIRRKEIEKRNLENDFVREEARWNANKTPGKLDEALIAHGLVMTYPKEDQLVRMNRIGKPNEGQLSLSQLYRQPNNSGSVARSKKAR